MGTKTLAGQRHMAAWPAGSRGWCARGPWIETQGSHHIIAHAISRQIGFSGSGVRVNRANIFSFYRFSPTNISITWFLAVLSNLIKVIIFNSIFIKNLSFLSLSISLGNKLLIGFHIFYLNFVLLSDM